MGKTLDIMEQLRRAIAAAERGGMNRAQIAIAAKTTDSQVKRIAEGATTPRMDTAATIAGVIGYRFELVKKDR
jgi:ribosome-binding protein aMBF1 (putative translation factor)